jgi:hypothetical protein
VRARKRGARTRVAGAGVRAAAATAVLRAPGQAQGWYVTTPTAAGPAGRDAWP